jgi:glycosyltransferase involved in cell wall biosynthesis
VRNFNDVARTEDRIIFGLEGYCHGNRCKEGLVTGKGDDDDLVSVVVPAFNRGRLLTRALESLVRQTHENLQVIVVDDGSQESIGRIVEGFADPRLSCIRHETNRGVSAARNTGIKAAVGNYVTFLDSDDEYLPEKVARQLAHLKGLDREGCISYCGVEEVSDPDGTSLGSTTYFKEGDLLHDALCSCVLIVGKLMLRKQDHLRVGGFDEGMRKHEDWDYLIRLAKAYQFFPLRDVLVRVHRHGEGQLTKKDLEVSQLRRVILERYQDLYAADPLAHSIFLSEQGCEEGVEGLKRQARRSLLKSIALAPYRLDPYVKLAMLETNRMRRKHE